MYPLDNNSLSNAINILQAENRQSPDSLRLLVGLSLTRHTSFNRHLLGALF